MIRIQVLNLNKVKKHFCHFLIFLETPKPPAPSSSSPSPPAKKLPQKEVTVIKEAPKLREKLKSEDNEPKESEETTKKQNSGHAFWAAPANNSKNSYLID